ncbi:MAG TPA: hypothetical protein VK579_00160, partial [Terriglobales bacterium]|nr:hypothetical protein [Terriglobales bacterium]
MKRFRDVRRALHLGTLTILMSSPLWFLGCSPKKTEVAPQSQEKTLSKAPAQQPTNNRYQLGTPVVFGLGGTAGPFKVSGWSQDEQGHTWTDKELAVLSFQIEPGQEPLVLRMTLTGLTKEPSLPFQPVEVDVNGSKVADWQVANTSQFTTVIPPEAVKGGGSLRIEFKTPKATSPASLGMNGDSRVLGISVSDLVI